MPYLYLVRVKNVSIPINTENQLLIPNTIKILNCNNMQIFITIPIQCQCLSSF
jgi:hypothetical protein